MAPVYLDYNATTPLDPRVFEAMRPFFMEEFGNAGSRSHPYGQRAKEAVERARRQVAALIDARPEEIIFTSGATESNNIALLGLAEHGSQTGRKHVLISAIEHKAVLEPAARLTQMGFEVETVPVTERGFVDPAEVKGRLRPDTLLVSVMHANNETGVLQEIGEIGAILEQTETLFHIDAAQSFGKEVDVLKRAPYDLLSISGHKIYGPKGVGALYARRRGAKKRPIAPLMVGGGQELGMRPGTLPVPLVVGIGVAAELAGKEYKKRKKHAAILKGRLLSALQGIPHKVNGDIERCQPHVLNICFHEIDSEALMVALREVVAVSNGSACTSASYTPSHVLKAMGCTDEEVSSSIRFSWGPGVENVPWDQITLAVKSFRGD